MSSSPLRSSFILLAVLLAALLVSPSQGANRSVEKETSKEGEHAPPNRSASAPLGEEPAFLQRLAAFFPDRQQLTLPVHGHAAEDTAAHTAEPRRGEVEDNAGTASTVRTDMRTGSVIGTEEVAASTSLAPAPEGGLPSVKPVLKRRPLSESEIHWLFLEKMPEAAYYGGFGGTYEGRSNFGPIPQCYREKLEADYWAARTAEQNSAIPE